MHNLILLRHAETVGSLSDDFNRTLTPHGKKQAKKLAEFFANNEEYLPDLVLCSSALRTRQTAAPIIENTKIKIKYLPELYNISYEKMARIISEHADIENLMIISHNPAISQFAHLLHKPTSIANDVSLKPSQMAIFEVAALNDLGKNKKLKLFYESI